MGETKKIVVEHFPADKLPEELRRGIESGEMVRVTVEANGPRDISLTAKPIDEFYGCAKGFYANQGIDPAEFIRQLRDEWH